jgi:tRNA-specific 2-thiouridylase
MPESERKKIAVAMSGGVDSSVTAALLKAAGHQVFGITMRLWDGASAALDDARRVADHLGIEHHVAPFEGCFEKEIMGYFASEYVSGRTPNPCARCNLLIKFGALLDTAKELGADMLATGHYARILNDGDGGAHLLKAVNLPKDQSYFLFSLKKEQLKEILFPLGEMADKGEVRRMAAELGIPVAEKSDSQDICFIPDGDYIGFLEQRGAGSPPGDFILEDGRVIGRHKGIHCYTVGQRRGMGIAWSEPLYVVRIDAASNSVIVGVESELYRDSLAISRCSWIQPLGQSTESLECKIRYRHRQVPCHVTALPGERAGIRFTAPQKGVTPGQVAVVYQGDEVMGGGWID